MMADGLASISIESLTAAVTSLLQKPLPDMHVLPSASQPHPGPGRRNACLSNTLGGIQVAGNARSLTTPTAGECPTSIPNLTPLNTGNMPALNASTNLQTLSTTSLESLLRSVGIQPIQGTSNLTTGTPLVPQPMQIASSLSQLPMVGTLPGVCYTAVGASDDNQNGSQGHSVPVFLKPVSTMDNKASSKFVKLLPKQSPVNILPRPDASSFVMPQHIQLLSNPAGVKLASVISTPDLDTALMTNPAVSVLNIEKAISTSGLSTVLDLQALQTIVQNQLNSSKEIVPKPQNNLSIPILPELSNLIAPPPSVVPLTMPSQDNSTGTHSKGSSSIIGSVLEHILQSSGNDGMVQPPLVNMNTSEHGTVSVDMTEAECLELQSYDALALPDPSPTKDVPSLSNDIGNMEVPNTASTASTVGEVGSLEIDDEQVDETANLVFCLDCNRMLEAPCGVHDNDYRHVADTPMPTRARATLPTCLFLHQTSTMQLTDQMGVWCKETVSDRTKFGPVECSTEPNDDFPKMHAFHPFKVYKGENLFAMYDTTSEDTSNWMMFIRLARSLLEQNCVLYQDGVELYVVTKTEIKANEELLLWFSEDICLNYGVSQDPSNSKIGHCPICGVYVISRKELNLHLRYIHPKQFRSQWTCAVCMKGFSSSSKLNNHMLSHMGVKPHRCVHCNKMFSDYSNLKAHQSIHTGEKKFQCTECNKTFRQKAHLNSHTLTHKGVKDFKCEYCERTFTRHSDCKTHTYSHTKERSFTCNICNKIFYKTQNYKKHLKVHTGERNYMCNKCFKGFHTKYHRDRHLKICKEVCGKEELYMSLEEVAKLDNTCDVVC